MEEYLIHQSTIQDPNIYTFDTYINNKLKFGEAQRKLSTSLFLLLFSEGSQSIVLGLLLPTLSIQWNITIFQKSLLITIVYLGVVIGSAFQGISDTYGRYKIITVAGIIQAIAGLLSTISPNYPFFLFIRFLYGIGIGIVLPLSGTYICEITPNANRAKIMGVSRVYWSTGAIITCILSYLLLSNNHWRILLLIICLPGIYALYLHMNEGKQSPRFLILKGHYQQAKTILQQMQQMNQSEKMTNREFQKLKDWAQHFHYTSIDQGNFSLFGEYLAQTLKLIVSWFTVCFLYYGIMLLLPLILSQNVKSSRNVTYLIILMVSSFQIVSFYMSNMIMDYPSLGRKNTLIMSFSVCAFCSFILMFNVKSFMFSLMFILIKFFVTLAFITLYSYTPELYPTLIRGKAMGVTSLVGRISIVLLGFVGVYALHAMAGKGLYFIFIILSGCSLVSIYSMPYDTLGRTIN